MSTKIITLLGSGSLYNRLLNLAGCIARNINSSSQAELPKKLPNALILLYMQFIYLSISIYHNKHT